MGHKFEPCDFIAPLVRHMSDFDISPLTAIIVRLSCYLALIAACDPLKCWHSVKLWGTKSCMATDGRYYLCDESSSGHQVSGFTWCWKYCQYCVWIMGMTPRPQLLFGHVRLFMCTTRQTCSSIGKYFKKILPVYFPGRLSTVFSQEPLYSEILSVLW